MCSNCNKTNNFIIFNCEYRKYFYTSVDKICIPNRVFMIKGNPILFLILESTM